ncbi:MAG TPA: hypothetical protein VGK17_24975 [Propionicimonas sp.]|jgi:hypothetical protein
MAKSQGSPKRNSVKNSTRPTKPPAVATTRVRTKATPAPEIVPELSNPVLEGTKRDQSIAYERWNMFRCTLERAAALALSVEQGIERQGGFRGVAADAAIVLALSAVEDDAVKLLREAEPAYRVYPIENAWAVADHLLHGKPLEWER